MDKKTYTNESVLERLTSLISEGERLWEEFKANEIGIIEDVVSFTRWSTSCLNILDKLSVSTNRFVKQFEIWVIGGPGQKMNIGAALGILKSAKDEYSLGLAIDYHLSVSAAVFSGLLDEADYLIQKKYLRAAAVLIGASLEEGLKTRAKSELIEIGQRDTLNPLIHKLKSPEIGVLTAFEATELEAVAKMRNDAAHGGEFEYSKNQVEEVHKKVTAVLQKLLGTK
ncbi:hypothetical protein AB9P05_21535 [Roseivirga sp. BDSF3-8]|uniref:hypothetical protein n=1 Tax=Roseivirga sp. BDSF3-8 TaxID=3241598 RepID=UPI00353242F7